MPLSARNPWPRSVRVRHAHHQVGVHGSLDAPTAVPSVRGSPARLAEHHAVRPRKINLLEDASRLGGPARKSASGRPRGQPRSVRRASRRARSRRRGGRRRRFQRRTRWCPCPSLPGMRPMASGRNPRGSRAAKIWSRVMITGECAFNAPQRVGNGFRQRCLVRLRDQVDDTRCRWRFGRSSLAVPSACGSVAFTRLPLCAIAICPCCSPP